MGPCGASSILASETKQCNGGGEVQRTGLQILKTTGSNPVRCSNKLALVVYKYNMSIYNQYFCQHCRSAYSRSQEKLTPGYCSLNCSVVESKRQSQKTFKELTLEDRIKNRPGGAYLEYNSGIPPELAVETAPVKRREYKCVCCGIADYNGRPLKLQLFHHDGNQKNFDPDNVKFLCPNCLSQHQ